MALATDIDLREFLNKQKHIIKIEAIAKASGSGQRLRRFLAERDNWFGSTKEVNIELVKLYESLGKYLQQNKIIEPKGLFK